MGRRSRNSGVSPWRETRHIMLPPVRHGVQLPTTVGRRLNDCETSNTHSLPCGVVAMKKAMISLCDEMTYKTNS